MREIKFKLYQKYEDWNLTDIVNIFQINDYSDDLANMEICQYTGLLDKNGVEIYEGDILQSSIGCKSGKAIVEWNNKSSGFEAIMKPSTWCLLQSYLHTAKVIGNIYENKELLE